MPVTHQKGKDSVIFVTKEDHSSPSTVTLPESEPPEGVILPDGSINWNCPCVGSIVTGPCGVEFREAFTCFYYSKAEPKGSDCFDAFKVMHECMAKYPTLYNKEEKAEDIEDALADMSLDDTDMKQPETEEACAEKEVQSPDPSESR